MIPTLASLPPADLAWLREHRYLNGFGPRTWRFAGLSILSRWSLPTPGLTPACEQHDLAHLLGGTEQDRADADGILVQEIRAIADCSWFLRAWAIRAALPGICAWLDAEGASHFRHRAAGPREFAECMAELRAK